MHPLLRSLDEKIGSLLSTAREVEELSGLKSAQIDGVIENLKTLRGQAASLVAELEADTNPAPEHVQRRGEINNQLAEIEKLSSLVEKETWIIRREACQLAYDRRNDMYQQIAAEIQQTDSEILGMLENAFQLVKKSFALRDRLRLHFKNARQIGMRLGLPETSLEGRQVITPWSKQMSDEKTYIQDFFNEYAKKRSETSVPGENLLEWFSQRW